jgi:hypothetical protein
VDDTAQGIQIGRRQGIDGREPDYTVDGWNSALVFKMLLEYSTPLKTFWRKAFGAYDDEGVSVSKVGGKSALMEWQG